MISMFLLLKRIIFNRAGLILALANFLLCALAYQQRDFERALPSQPFLLQLMLILNLPSFLVTSFIFMPLIFSVISLSVSDQRIDLEIIIFLLVASFQWLFIGYWTGKLIAKIRSRNP
jgi:hypothetical protein